MIAIVCGGRDYTDAARVAQVLDAAVVRLGLACIIEGAARGADTLAKQWALARGDIGVIDVPADWTRYQNRAGPIRNALMFRILMGDGYDGRAGFCFPGGAGTANMRGLLASPEAQGKGVKVYDIG